MVERVPLRLIEVEPDGYCDPATGLCAVPETVSATPTPPSDARLDGDEAKAGEGVGGRAER